MIIMMKELIIIIIIIAAMVIILIMMMLMIRKRIWGGKGMMQSWIKSDEKYNREQEKCYFVLWQKWFLLKNGFHFVNLRAQKILIKTKRKEKSKNKFLKIIFFNYSEKLAKCILFVAIPFLSLLSCPIPSSQTLFQYFLRF